MDKKQLIKYAIIIIIILIVLFLSQWAYSSRFIKPLISNATDQVGAYLSKGSSWVVSTIYPKISGEVQKRGDIIKNEITQEKQKVSENIGTKIENYFSGIKNSILNPGQPSNCPSQP